MLAAISDAATLTVNPFPDITATPSLQTICSGATTNIALTSNVTGTTFAWTVAQSGVTGAADGSGSNIVQPLTNSGIAAGTATYSITPTASGCSGTSTDVVITVNLLPDVIATPSSQAICSGSATGITLTSNVTGTAFAWTVVQSEVIGATEGSGSSIAQTLTNTGTTAGTATYSITPTASGCSGTSTDVVITVNPIPNVTPSSASQTICGGAAPSVTLTSNVTGTTFAWTVTQSEVTGATDGSGNSIAQTLTNSGTSARTATYSITPTASGCSGTSTDVVITVNPMPYVIATPSSQAICSGSATGITLTSNVTEATFAWTVISNGATGAFDGTGSSIAQTLTNSGTSAGIVTYSITLTANTCSGTSTDTDVVITVNPIPNLQFSVLPSQTICGGSIAITLISNVSGTTFAWTVAQNGVTGASAGSGNSIAQTLTNSGTSAGTATYTITPTASGCSGTPTNVVITETPCGTTGCYTGTCSYGACNYYTSGERNCGACKTCDNATSGNCVNITNNTQDTEGSNLCNSNCYDCRSGSCGVSPLLVNNAHCEIQCLAAGGTVVSDGSGHNMCRFNAASCQSGWSQYQNWSTTGISEVFCGGIALSTQISGHSWSNNATLESSWCINADRNDGTCVCSGSLIFWYPYSSDGGFCICSSTQFFAIITQIGCY